MKTPVMRPVTEAVLFGFERIGMVIRIAWLPIALVIALYLMIASSFFGGISSLPDLSGDDPEDAMQSILGAGGLYRFYILQFTLMPIATTLILSCVYVAITRASTLADYEPPRLPFYFALGPREFRYFIVRILYAILTAVVVVVAGGLGAAVGVLGLNGVAGADFQMAALVIAVTAAAILALAIAGLWVIVRFMPVLVIAAVENRISFGDAWKMSKGNFWRILLSSAMFVAMLQGALTVLILAVLVPAGIIIALVAALGFGLAGPAAFGVFALFALIVIPVVIAIAAFGVAAQASFPARLYAYLSGCGDACKI